MIGRISIQENIGESEEFSHVKKIPFFQQNSEIEFKPGLNILFGPNGIGKSTILKLIGLPLAAIQGGRSVVTHSYMLSHARSNKPINFGVELQHDGQGIMYFDSDDTIGLTHGYFDDDFFSEGSDAARNHRKMSHGLKTVSKIDRIKSVLSGEKAFPATIENRMKGRYVNDVWKEKVEALDETFKGTIPIGQPTTLIDEPESHLDLIAQKDMWEFLGNPSHHENFQLIVSTHSPFSLGIKHANYIDIKNGYMESCKDTIKSFAQSL
jgi:predicted ATPase